MEITVLSKHGESIHGIARATGLSRNTVRRYLREGEAAATRKRGLKRPEKLDPFKGYIAERMQAAAPDLILAAVLLREIQARGYDGGYTRLKVFVRGLRPAPKPDPVVRFETEPGQQMQADWATVGRGSDELKVFIGTLGWSRTAYVEFCDDEQFEMLRLCHEHAFDFFAGVPREVLYDNMKTVVLERNAYRRNLHRFHPGFLDYAGHAGFLPRLCRPYRAKTKGKVERFIGYLKRSFWIPFVASCRQAGIKPDCRATNAAVAIWLREVANARVHATTSEVPAERMIIERGKLQALPKPYKGRRPKDPAAHVMATSSRPRAVICYQHPLSTYDALLEPMALEVRP
ncbi:MAG: IS21 family transposase [Hyphomicrobiaceae bacterium TMED74]|nr:MAG: IS21 family transposase [Hyphomicrobiaceae bacterium TMED74]